MSTPDEIPPDADANRIDKAVADIERYCQEVQMPPSEQDAGVANLLAETERCQRLTALEIDNVIAETKRRRKEVRPLVPWQLFAVGFAFGAVCFVAAVTLFRFLGYPSSGLIIFWLCLVPAAAIILLRQFGFGEAQKT
jgi:hypothetical protein